MKKYDRLCLTMLNSPESHLLMGLLFLTRNTGIQVNNVKHVTAASDSDVIHIFLLYEVIKIQNSKIPMENSRHPFGT